MYKKQMLFQKIICLLVLICAALIFIQSLGLMTDLYDGLTRAIPDSTELDMGTPMGPKVEGARILYDMQPFNRSLTKNALVVILLAVLLFITCTNTRRRYYVSNYVAIALCAGGGIAFACWSFFWLSSWKLTYQMRVDFEGLKEFAEKKHFQYFGPDHTFWFDSGIVLDIVLIVLLALLVLNMIWKIIMMKSEKKLLQNGKESAVNG